MHGLKNVRFKTENESFKLEITNFKNSNGSQNWNLKYIISVKRKVALY